MNYDNLIKEIESLLEVKLGSKYNISSHEILKNNNLKLHSITIKRKGESIAPAIVINNFIHDYQQGKTTEEITNQIINIYKQNNTISFDQEDFLNWEKVKHNIIFQIVNTSKNKEFLSNIPHTNYLDFSIIYKVLINSSHLGMTTITINNYHLKLWDSSLKEIHSLSVINTPLLLPYNIQKIEDILSEVPICILDDYSITDELIPMYVLTNSEKQSGAGCILYPNILKSFSNSINNNFFILPSSTHEVIIVVDQKLNPLGLSTMVKEINETEILQEEFLSDNIYYYNQETNQLDIVII